MGRSYKRTRKTPTQNQKDHLARAREARELRSATDKDIRSILESRKNLQQYTQQEARAAVYHLRAKNATKKYQLLRRRTKRIEEANIKHKEHLAMLKGDNTMLRREGARAEKENQQLQDDIKQVLQNLQGRITKLSEERKELQREKSNLKKKASRFHTIKKAMQERARRSAARGYIFKLTHRGIYTKEARRLARYLSSVGTAEAKVGEAISAVGKVMGVEVDRVMDKRTVKRAVLESGVAAEIQLGYEMAKSNSKFCQAK
jgi:DNA repair exonuclease SbcCD ATPase subunit